MRRSTLAVLCSVALLGACTSSKEGGAPPRPDRTATTAPVDRSGIALAGVAGQTTTTIVETGTATIKGLVSGPKGFVVGATVRIERLVGGREIRNDIVTGPDGQYLLPNVPGGRYRLRAFLAPAFAQTKPEVQFLTDGNEHTIDLEVTNQSGLLVRAGVAPDPPQLNQAVNMVVSVSNRTVDNDGVVRSTPVVGSVVELTGLGRWRLRDDSSSSSSTSTTSTTSTTLPAGPTSSTASTSSTTSTTSTTSPRGAPPSASARTDSAGRVRYELRCASAGAAGLSLKIPTIVTPPPDGNGTPGEPYQSNETIALNVPDCIDPVTTTTTTTSTTTPPTTAKP